MVERQDFLERIIKTTMNKTALFDKKTEEIVDLVEKNWEMTARIMERLNDYDQRQQASTSTKRPRRRNLLSALVRDESG